MPSDSAPRRWLIPLTVALVLAFYFFFTWKSLGLYFDNDDMMNLYLAWSKPLAEVLRPVGGLFYRAMFAMAGFNPVPFRIAVLALGALNIGLCWWFTKLISGSDRVAALAILLLAFHSRLMEVWWRTAMVYDLLCFTFLYFAACLYLDARKRNAMPGPGRSAAILISFLLALGAKENALALPVILLACTCRVRASALPPGFRLARTVQWPITLTLICIPYLYLKTHGPMSTNVFYAPEYTFTHFAGAWSKFLGYLLVLNHDVQPWKAIAILAALLCIAALARSRQLTLAWVILFATTLPVAFIPYRGGYVLYTAYPGAALYAATILVAAQDYVTKTQPQYRTALACAVFALAGWRWGKLNLHDQRIDPRPWLYESQRQVHAMADQMLALNPHLPKGARVLFLEDAFGTDEWTPYFVMKLLYRDDSLVPDRIKMMDRKPTDWNEYQYVLTFDAGRYRQLKP